MIIGMFTTIKYAVKYESATCKLAKDAKTHVDWIKLLEGISRSKRPFSRGVIQNCHLIFGFPITKTAIGMGFYSKSSNYHEKDLSFF